MTTQFIGEIRCVGFNFAPLGWALCDGQIMSIAQNTALFSLLGTTYGGNGINTFALPNLQGVVPVHMGTGPGGVTFNIGQVGGSYNNTLSTSNLPPHTHTIPASTDLGTTDDPSGAVVAEGGSYATPADKPATAAPTGSVGSGLPFSITQPYLTVNFIIALEGIFPSRS